MFPELLQNKLQVLQVLSRSITVDHDVVKIDEHKLPKVFSEDFIHESLEGCGCIRQPETHHCPLEQSF